MFNFNSFLKYGKFYLIFLKCYQEEFLGHYLYLKLFNIFLKKVSLFNQIMQ